MKNVYVAGVTAGLSLVFGFCVYGQSGGPAPVIKIIREEIKPGREAAHEMVEQGYVRTLSKAKYPHYFALSPVTGTSEVWFVEGYPSYEAVGKTREMIFGNSTYKSELDKLDSEDGELRSGGRVVLARYRNDLSYLGDKYADVRGTSHYTAVTLFRTRPGRGQDFLRMRTILNEAFAKAGFKSPTLMYQVSSGMPLGTFISFHGMPSMKDMDPVAGEMTIAQAMGEETGKEYGKLMSEALLVTDRMLFNFSPKMSYVSDEVAAKDPAFWRPKAAK